MLRITSPRGYEIYRGDLSVTADEVESRCSADALGLSADRRHDYTIHVETEDGRKAERQTVRVLGGERGDAGHVVDPLTTQTPAAVVGHLTRAVIDLAKQVTSLAQKVSDNNSEEARENARELGKLRRAALKQGDVEVMRMVLEQQREEARQSSGLLNELGREALGFAKLTLGRVSPDAATAALAEFRSSVTEAQHAKAIEAFGPARWARILAAPTPDAVVLLLVDAPEGAFPLFVGTLSEAQQQLAQAALASAYQKHNAAKEANGAAKEAS